MPKATGRAERLKKEAQGYNERTINEALGQVAQFEKLLPEYQAAPKVTRDRLYLDAMEQVYSNTSKVLIDSESSGNLLYLPIDKLAGQDNKRRSRVQISLHQPTIKLSLNHKRQKRIPTLSRVAPHVKGDTKNA